jgi:hypothetical protein
MTTRDLMISDTSFRRGTRDALLLLKSILQRKTSVIQKTHFFRQGFHLSSFIIPFFLFSFFF